MEVPYSKIVQLPLKNEFKRGVRLKNEPHTRPTYYWLNGSYVSFQREGPTDWPPTTEGELSFRYDLLGDLEDGSPPGIALQRARSRAYGRFVEQLGARSELGTTLAETRSSLEMIAKRATQLGDAWTALKEGKFRKFLKKLDIDPKRKHRDWLRSKPKEAGGLWIEYWFGWAPFIGDIFASIEVAVQPYPFIPIVATATVPWTYHKLVGPPTDHWLYDASGKSKVRLSADVRVSNPNLYLANQLGMLNPAAIAWNVLPFSWLIGWVSNISQVLTSLTDFAGLELKDAQTTRVVLGDGKGHYHYSRAPYARTTSFKWHGVHMMRQVGVFTPPLTPITLPPGLSWTRGATAIGLLLQKLKA